MDDIDVIKRLSDKTNLSVFAVAELLSRGWRYVERTHETSRWEAPSWRIEQRDG